MTLYNKNTFQSFWGVPPSFAPSTKALIDQVKRYFPDLSDSLDMNWEIFINQILGEEQFGQEHFQLNGMRYFYYQIRPFLPLWFRPLIHKIISYYQVNNKYFKWPQEDTLPRFLFNTMHAAIQEQKKTSIDYIHFWPREKRFAFVITHDIETVSGQSFVRQLADLDEKYGFYSSFNFVLNEYTIDLSLINELRRRGFEIGIHGWKHDGKLFSSRAVFEYQSHLINQSMHEFGAVGFRSPLTHRNPQWMQRLEIEYDSSFFDTDPFEPIPGGTMSIWPFQIGRFVELPYTLAQDHTMMNTLGEKTPRLWLDKVDFIRKYCGMALVNVHPDYQRTPSNFAIYEDFLSKMSQRNDYWHALPRDAAKWWKKRSELDIKEINNETLKSLPGASIGTIQLLNGRKEIELQVKTN